MNAFGLLLVIESLEEFVHQIVDGVRVLRRWFQLGKYLGNRGRQVVPIFEYLPLGGGHLGWGLVGRADAGAREH